MFFVTIAVKIVELIAEIPGISFLNRMGGAGLGVVRAVLWIWIFFAVVYCFQATHWGNVCMKQIQGDMALAWLVRTVLQFGRPHETTLSPDR